MQSGCFMGKLRKNDGKWRKNDGKLRKNDGGFARKVDVFMGRWEKKNDGKRVGNERIWIQKDER
jgi:hypothetical protein